MAITKYMLISVKQISLQQLSEVQQLDVRISQHRRKRIPGQLPDDENARGPRVTVCVTLVLSLTRDVKG